MDTFLKHSFIFLEKKHNKYFNLVLVFANNWNVDPDLKQRYGKIIMLRLMVIIIDYLETTLFQSKYAKIDSNYHRLPYIPYDNYNTPQAQSTVGYADRLKRTTT